MNTNAKPLNWALVVATYRREQILPRCLRLGVQQTRPPVEVIVVDASPGWDKTRDTILGGLAAEHPQIRWSYQAAEKRSLPAQRNQGIRQAHPDILFLVDDDSLMYSDCAEKIPIAFQPCVSLWGAEAKCAKGRLYSKLPTNRWPML